jgi:hypothetical protein
LSWYFFTCCYLSPFYIFFLQKLTNGLLYKHEGRRFKELAAEVGYSAKGIGPAIRYLCGYGEPLGTGDKGNTLFAPPGFASIGTQTNERRFG